MKLSKRAEKALRASINHWKRLAEGKQRAGEAPGSADCALCVAYQLTDDTCGRCPIFQRTGVPFCCETPFNAAYAAWAKLKRNKGSFFEFQQAAAKEVEFLESLLPKDDER